MHEYVIRLEQKLKPFLFSRCLRKFARCSHKAVHLGQYQGLLMVTTLNPKSSVGGSPPPKILRCLAFTRHSGSERHKKRAGVAQLVEHYAENVIVGGSIPPSSNKMPHSYFMSFFLSNF